jgi:hypothetical protein
LVINLKVMAGDKVVTHFDPPMELRVRYKPSDYIFAYGILKLGYYDGLRWSEFLSPNNYIVIPDDPAHKGKGGWGIVEIHDWTDPTVGWGR